MPNGRLNRSGLADVVLSRRGGLRRNLWAALLVVAGCQKLPLRSTEIESVATARPTTVVGLTTDPPPSPREVAPPAPPPPPAAPQPAAMTNAEVTPATLADDPTRDGAPPRARSRRRPRPPLLDAAVARAEGRPAVADAPGGSAGRGRPAGTAGRDDALKDEDRFSIRGTARRAPSGGPRAGDGRTDRQARRADGREPEDASRRAAQSRARRRRRRSIRRSRSRPVSTLPRDEWADSLSRLQELARRRAGEPGEAAEAWGIRGHVLDWLAGNGDDPRAGNARAWNRVLAALSTATSGESVDAAALSHHLTGAVDTLEAFAPLQVRVLSLCRKVDGYGQYEPLDAPTGARRQAPPRLFAS